MKLLIIIIAMTTFSSLSSSSVRKNRLFFCRSSQGHVFTVDGEMNTVEDFLSQYYELNNTPDMSKSLLKLKYHGLSKDYSRKEKSVLIEYDLRV